jgi:serine protease Do
MFRLASLLLPLALMASGCQPSTANATDAAPPKLALAPPVAASPVAAPPVAAAPPVSPPADRQLSPMPSLAPLVKELRPAVVNVYTTQSARPRSGSRLRRPQGPGPGQGQDLEDFFDRFFNGEGGGPDRGFDRQALGSGFLIGDGLALTNNHVIEGADGVKVKLADGREFEAKVVGRDSSTDVALLQLQGDAAKSTPSVRLGDSDVLEVGDYVVAIGNPFGLSHTTTSGIVSAKERIIGAGPYDDFIQTDASINPGNSGGPLFNLRGEVVGINTAIVARGQGIGFAVPINLVKDLLPQLRESGRVSRGWLGVGIQEVTPELAQTFGLGSQKGALISQVFPNGPAARAGVQSGDVVIDLNGRAVDSPGALSRAVASVRPGGTAKLRLLREGKERVVEVKVAERDEEGLAQGRTSGEERPGAGENTVGLAVEPLTPELARRLNVPAGEALVVTGVQSGSAAEAAGVREGDVLMELQRQPVASLDDLRKAARSVKSGETVLFRVRRGGSALYLAARAR